MKYFTREYWLSMQNRDYSSPSTEPDRFELYYKDLDTLRDRLKPEAFHFFSDADVHDGELLELAVIDGNRPAPLGHPAREWTYGPGCPVRVKLRVLQADDTLVWSVHYSRVRSLKVEYSAEATLFPSGSGGGFGFGDWGYHELRDAGDGFLAHEVLFATGATILVEFGDVAVKSEPARSAAEQ